MKTKRFPLRVLLTVTTKRLLTQPQGPHDNGIGDLYAILDWMTNDSNFTHQLPRVADECAPWLLRWFPELAPCGSEYALKSLDNRMERGISDDDMKMWFAELKVMFPNLKDEYDVPQIPADDHERKNAYDELVQMRGTDEGIIPVATP